MLDPAEIWRSVAANKTQGPPPSWSPVPALPASGGFPREEVDFLREVRLPAKDLPWQAQPLKEESFRKDFRERQHVSLMASAAAFFSQLVDWHACLAMGHSALSPVSLSEIFKAFASACDTFGSSLFPTERPALDKAVAARLALRREAFRGLPKATQEHLLRVGPFTPGVVPELLLKQCLSAIPPTINVLAPRAPRYPLSRF